MTNEERAREVMTRALGPQSLYHNAEQWWHLQTGITAVLDAKERETVERCIEACDRVGTDIQTDMEKSDSDELRSLEDVELGVIACCGALQELRKGLDRAGQPEGHALEETEENLREQLRRIDAHEERRRLGIKSEK